EVVTGFRLAYGGAQEYFGVLPDLAVYGKALGGGYPIAALVGRKSILDLTDPNRTEGRVHFSGTFNGHALAAAAANATLKVLRQPGTYEHLWRLGQVFRAKITSILDARGVAGQVLGRGP